jgi:hypothetical protein
MLADCRYMYRTSNKNYTLTGTMKERAQRTANSSRTNNGDTTYSTIPYHSRLTCHFRNSLS